MDNRGNNQNIFDDLANIAGQRSSRSRFNSRPADRDEHRRFANTRESIFSNLRENELADTIQTLTGDYNDNFRQYQENTLLLISNLQEIWNHTRRNNPPPPRPNLSYRFVPQNMATFNQPVIVAPTEEQIRNAIEEFAYSSNNPTLNTCCPISIDNFEDGEPILRILQCSHSFRPTSLRRWFRTNTRCPVCRYDIREYHTRQPNPEENLNNDDGELLSQPAPAPHQFVRTTSTGSNNSLDSSLVSATADIITRVLQSALSNDGSHALEHDDHNVHLLSFELPLNLETDLSNGGISY